MLVRLGKVLFQFRALIAVPFFVLLILLSRPVVHPVHAYIFIIAGGAIRMWAAGYIGLPARKTSFGTSFRINSGPYKYLRHPLYIGNFLLVAGVTILFNPFLWYALIIIILFIVIYGIITVSEEVYIKQLQEKKVVFQYKNCAGEISTIVVLAMVVLIHVFVPKNLLLNI
jgi:protein-S-isoprenylcysteine O-methyltransferase Ste14